MASMDWALSQLHGMGMETLKSEQQLGHVQWLSQKFCVGKGEFEFL